MSRSRITRRQAKSSRAVLLLLAALFCLALSAATPAQTTGFTYQGALSDGGTMANGNYDLQFTLWDSLSGGNQIGPTQTINTTPVSNGIFSVRLDFGVGSFPGNARFLEVSARPSGVGAFTSLSPRQPLTSTPYAIRSIFAGTADLAQDASHLDGLPPSQYVKTNDARLSDARPPTAGSNSYIQNTNSAQAANFNINGSGTATTLSGGVVNAQTQYNMGGQRLLATATSNTTLGSNAGVVTNGGANSYFGESAGAHTLNAFHNSFFGWAAGDHNLGGSGNSFFGSASGTGNTSGVDNSYFGYLAGNAIQQGQQNSFFGSNAGKEGTTGNRNSFFGFESGRNNKADNNSFFGSSAGLANTTGQENVFFGQNTGSANKTGSGNTFVGTGAGEENTGSENSFFGNGSGKANTTGTRNSFFGTLTGVINETTSDNSFFGYEAGIASRAAANSFVGSRAGEKNITGFANSFFGFETGNGNIGGFNNSFFGRGAGKANFNGDNNTLLGAFAEVDSGDLNFATAIGSGAHVGSSNTIVLGRANGSDAVQVPGTLTLGTLGTAGVISLCRNVLNQISACSSSLRYKTNVQPFTAGLAVINRLRPITFDWKEGGLHDFGLGAEEVARVEPLLAFRNGAGEIEGVKYNQLSVVLINAVKEQQAQIAQQQQEINELRRLLIGRHRHGNRSRNQR